MEQEPMDREPMEREAMEREPMEQETMEQEPMVQTDPVAFTVKLTAKDLWKFSLYHSNKGMLGIFNVICWLPPGDPTRRCTGRCLLSAR